LLIILAVLLVIASTIYGAVSHPHLSGGTAKTPPSFANGIGVMKAQDGEYIGISDGTYAFDTGRPDGIYKRDAAEKLKANDPTAAVSLWQQAIAQDTNDAETLIYLENQRVVASGNPYITVVVGTILSGKNAGVGRFNLQGAYVAQKEYNDGSKLPGGTQVRLLVASSGSQPGDATTVAKQIVQLAKADQTLVGVIGWPLSDPTLNVIKVLDAAHIPILASAASDELTGISPYFFRVAVSTKIQASVAVKFAEQTLHATKALIFTDPQNAYTSSLAKVFSQQFKADGNTIITTEQYTVGKSATVVTSLQNALNSNPAPDLIYFAGYASDASILLTDLPQSGPFANLPVLGGSGLYEIGGYQDTARTALSHLRFTAQAYPDEWEALSLSAQKPKFFADYANAFDPNRQHQTSPYGYTRPNFDAMLSYDAMLTVLSASNIALASGKQGFTPSDLQKALTRIKGEQTVQGVSGQITFGSDGEPLNKEVLIMCVAKDNTFHLIEARGQFLVGGSNQPLKLPPSVCS
jgi:ABC-type branched-subunit amino acid transport system substrate-binding protein